MVLCAVQFRARLKYLEDNDIVPGVFHTMHVAPYMHHCLLALILLAGALQMLEAWWSDTCCNGADDVTKHAIVYIMEGSSIRRAPYCDKWHFINRVNKRGSSPLLPTTDRPLPPPLPFCPDQCSLLQAVKVYHSRRRRWGMTFRSPSPSCQNQSSSLSQII